MVKSVHSKVYACPRRPYEKSRLDQELKLIGEYGLKNKKEVWRVKYMLAKVRQTARYLLTLPENDPKRLLEGNSLLRHLYRIGVLNESNMKLDMVLYLTVNNLLDRRLQTLVYKKQIAKSVHSARVLIKHRHIAIGRQLVNVPSYIVRIGSEARIDFDARSPFGSGRPGRTHRRKEKARNATGEEEDEE